MGLSDSQNVLR